MPGDLILIFLGYKAVVARLNFSENGLKFPRVAIFRMHVKGRRN
jgi:hypothetical protein